MTKTIITTCFSIISILLLSAVTIVAQEGKFNLDVKNSEVEWTGYHPGKAYEHWGTLKTKSGFVTFTKDNISAAEVLIDMNTLQNLDISNESDQSKLIGHLKSKDFFDVAEFPEAKLVVKKSELVKKGIFNLTADLTIKGITKEIKFEAQAQSTYDNGYKISAQVTINRLDFNVMFGWAIEDAMIDKDIKLDISIILKQGNKIAVDTKSSQVKWVGYHRGKSYENWGTLDIQSGSFAYSNGILSSGEILIDMNTLRNKDLLNDSDKETLVNHLKSADFFDVAKFPEAKLVVKKSVKGEKGALKVTADLSIKGITKEITFDASTMSTYDEGVKFETDIIINRLDFNVKFGSTVEDGMIDKDIKLNIVLICK